METSYYSIKRVTTKGVGDAMRKTGIETWADYEHSRRRVCDETGLAMREAAITTTSTF